MIIALGVCLLVSLLDPSSQHPVRDLDPDVKQAFEDKPVYLDRDELDDEEFAQKEDQSVQALSPEAVDTIHKINPLTIADQVSQRFRKGNQKAEVDNRSKAAVVNSQSNLRGDNSQGDQNFPLPLESKGEETLNQQRYIQQQAPKIVHKPLADDFGYSVIVLAGDAVHLPIKVQDKAVPKKNKGKEKLDDKDAYVNVQGQGFFKVGQAEEKVASAEKSNRKEIRVPKQFNKVPDFPVYDEDFSFLPDPFNGLLDKNYWKQADADSENISQTKPDMPTENLKLEESGLETHKMNRRSGKSVKHSRAADNQKDCGGYSGMGKHNMTNLN